MHGYGFLFTDNSMNAKECKRVHEINYERDKVLETGDYKQAGTIEKTSVIPRALRLKLYLIRIQFESNSAVMTSASAMLRLVWLLSYRCARICWWLQVSNQ